MFFVLYKIGNIFLYTTNSTIRKKNVELPEEIWYFRFRKSEWN